MRRRNGHRPSFPTRASARPGDGWRFRRAAPSTCARHRRGPDATAASAWTILLLHSFSAIGPSNLQCATASATGCSLQESVRHSASIRAFIIAGKRLDNYVPGAMSSAHDQVENARSPASCRYGNSATAARDHDIGLSKQCGKNTGGSGKQGRVYALSAGAHRVLSQPSRVRRGDDRSCNQERRSVRRVQYLAKSPPEPARVLRSPNRAIIDTSRLASCHFYEALNGDGAAAGVSFSSPVPTSSCSWPESFESAGQPLRHAATLACKLGRYNKFEVWGPV